MEMNGGELHHQLRSKLNFKLSWQLRLILFSPSMLVFFFFSRCCYWQHKYDFSCRINIL